MAAGASRKDPWATRTEALLALADGLSTVAEAMLGRGFEFSNSYTSYVDSLPPHDSMLLGTRRYLAEVLKEQLGVPYTLWMPSNRPRASSPFRSAYLDALVEALAANRFGDLHDIENEQIRALDPRLMRYQRLKYDDSDAYLNLKQRWMLAIEAEMPRAEGVDGEPISQLGAMLRHSGASLSKNWGKGKLSTFHAAKPTRDPSVSVVCALAEARKLTSGNWPVGFSIATAGDELGTEWPDRTRYSLAVDRLVPGGRYYLWFEDSATRRARGAQFLVALFEELWSIVDQALGATLRK